MKSTDTALLGHTSGDALSAAALSDLYTMCTAVLIQGRVLGILVGYVSFDYACPLLHAALTPTLLY